jgi:fibronectin-binding autotransporter adhesin
MSVKTSQTGRNSRLGNVSRLLSGASLTAVALLALPSAAQAQDANVYWDPNGSTVGSGGSGNWNTTSNSWSRSNNDVLGPWGAWNNDPLNPDNAIFGTTAGTLPVAPITLTQPIIVHNMTFQSVNDWVLNGGTLTLAGTDPTITTIGARRSIR